MESFSSRLAAHAQAQPDGRAITFLVDGDQQEETLSFAELYSKAHELACRLSHNHEAQRALIVMEPGLDFVVTLTACLMAGIAAIPSPPPAARLQSRSARRFAGLVADADPDLILVHSSMLRKLTWFAYDQAGLWSQRFVTIDATDGCASSSIKEPGDDQTAIIQYTSGSTATPRGVIISQANLTANLDAIRQRFALNRNSRVVSWLPLYHDMGLIGGVLESLWTGYELILFDTRHFAQKPLRWLAAIEHYQADTSGGANFGYQLCVAAANRLEEPPGFDLSRWQLAFSGAEPIRPQTLESFARTFRHCGFSRSAFYPTYGLAEATLMVSGPVPGAERPKLIQQNGRDMVSCGQAAPDTVIRIIDPELGQRCQDGETGEVWVSGPGVSAGYWQGTDAFADDPRRTLPDEPGLFLPTGDLGLLQDDELYIGGRLRDLVIIRGRNYFPQDIESAAATSHGALNMDGCAAFSVDNGEAELLIVACELNRASRRDANAAEILRTVAAQVTAQLEVSPYDVVLLKPGTLPRTTSGKLQRGRCRECYEQGQWDQFKHLRGLAPLDLTTRQFKATHRNERLADLEAYLCFRIGSMDRSLGHRVTPEMNLQALGIDSLKRIELGLWIEEEVGVTLELELLSDNLSINELAVEIRALVLQGNSRKPKVYRVPVPDQALPLTPLQRDFLEAEVEGAEGFLEVVFMRTPRQLNLVALGQALDALVQVHDALRMRFKKVQGQWQQFSDGPPTMPLRRIDASSLTREDFGRLRESLLADIESSIDLAAGSPVSAILVDRGAAGGSLLVTGFHHLVVDAVSISILITQLNQAYINALADRPPLSSLEGSTPQESRFGAWTLAQESYGCESVPGQRDYWTSLERESRYQFKSDSDPYWNGLVAVSPSLPVNQKLMAEFPEALDRNCLFIAALGWAWRDVVGEPEQLQLLENHGRHRLSDVDPASAVGWFVCHHPFLFHARGSVWETLIETQRNLLAVPDQGLGFGLLSSEERQRLKPSAMVQYRGAIDSAFRPDSRFPVIGVTHLTKPFHEARRQAGDTTVIWLNVTIRQGVFEWRVLYRDPIDVATAEQLSLGIDEFLSQLVSSR